MLARLLIAEHDFAGAAPHIDFLESILPANPELTTRVTRMRVATLDPVRDADKIKTYYDRTSRSNAARKNGQGPVGPSREVRCRCASSGDARAFSLPGRRPGGRRSGELVSDAWTKAQGP